MSSYGVEITSPSGNAFVIPDNNPFTFYRRFDMSASSSAGGTVSLDTGIPSSIGAMFFWKLVTTNSYVWDTEAYVSILNGRYYLNAKTGNVISGEVFQVYAFCDMELKDVSGGSGYGMQIFDANGNVIFGNETKPLKMYVDQTPPFGEYVHQYSYPTGFPAAFLGSALTNYTPNNSNPTYYTVPMGVYTPGDFIGARIMALYTGSKLFPNGTENWSYNRSLIYINTDQYD